MINGTIESEKSSNGFELRQHNVFRCFIFVLCSVFLLCFSVSQTIVFQSEIGLFWVELENQVCRCAPPGDGHLKVLCYTHQ